MATVISSKSWYMSLIGVLEGILVVGNQISMSNCTGRPSLDWGLTHTTMCLGKHAETQNYSCESPTPLMSSILAGFVKSMYRARVTTKVHVGLCITVPM
jgi:hypothetical protein